MISKLFKPVAFRSEDSALRLCAVAGIAVLLAVLSFELLAAGGYADPVYRSYLYTPPAPESQSAEEVLAKSEGCMSCHVETDQPSMHANPAVKLGCTDCHGGDATRMLPA